MSRSAPALWAVLLHARVDTRRSPSSSSSAPGRPSRALHTTGQRIARQIAHDEARDLLGEGRVFEPVGVVEDRGVGQRFDRLNGDEGREVEISP